MRERYSEPLTLDDLADAASVSKFYFLRVFTRVVGVTPGRFLSVVRLAEAKRLLGDTGLTVVEISARVGYGSVGSFARRFTETVGMSPIQYRRLRRGAAPSRDGGDAFRSDTGPHGSLLGRVSADGVCAGSFFVGVFDSPILQGRPAAWTTLAGPGPFTLHRVPVGRWYVHGDALGTGRGCADGPTAGSEGPLQVTPGAAARCPELTVRRPDWSRPPLLTALPFLEQPRPVG
ncbi:helix-turn-helix transcriptional regulator [Streptomyces sp. NBC_00893]|uniref:helix-turn-helix transcriptional regulator n=1 Tax=Streptomyces sp. NBC_00893 TaxID=2975862 RepID=UPI002253D3C3|nr:helix-turn-helix transcriptional regulator [Streptomyces sp. NBC_00893]MCX4849533.1 helix-turn-helix transcriptional regulator [Streptomyces sp. NBC_00893]